MGILNVTPDSFSDGGRFYDPQAALEQALQMEGEGADIIDVGGESTRPGADPVSLEEELRRVIPTIQAIRQNSDILISVDTSKAAVAEAAVKEGADIINDVTALGGDPAMMKIASASESGIILMHMQGEPRTMQQAPHYRDVVDEVMKFLRQRLDAAIGCGMAVERVVIDPGFGFGKTLEHNISLLRNLASLHSLARPILVGVSRKSFLARLAAAEDIDDRLWPAVALTSFCREMGAKIFRVHDPKPHAQALRMTEAIVEPC